MTMFIKIENGEPVGYPLVLSNMQYLFPNFNFNRILTSEMVAELGYAIYEFSQKPEVSKYKKLVEQSPVLNNDNGIYYQNWQLVDMNDEEKEEADNLQSRIARQERDMKLYQTDWTMLSDNALTQEKKQQYVVYRQSLRDISNQTGFPWDIVWPDNP